MTTTKPWYLSKTIWASLVTVLISVGSLLGLPEGMVDKEGLADAIMQVITAVTGLVAIFGRMTAAEKIH